MAEFNILRKVPLVKTMDNVLSDEECNQIINEAKDLLGEAKVVAPSGEDTVMLEYRNCSTAYFSEEDPITISIQDKISSIIGIDKSRFEGLAIIRYMPGEEFKRHPDYFHGPSGAKISKKGGNRVATVVMYLNDVEEGGDTDFPWMRLWVAPKKGSILFFDYSDPDPFIKRMSEHAGKPVIKGEKWIATIWIRENSREIEYPEESYVDIGPTIYKPLVDTTFELEVGPDNDRRLMKIELPANDAPENTIVVGFTGGMDSALLLYILGALNSQQSIPYFIKPVIITSGNGSLTGEAIGDSTYDAENMLSLIRSKINGNILNLTGYPGPKYLHPWKQISPGLQNFYRDFTGARKHINNIFLFAGDNEIPGDDTPISGGPIRRTSVLPYIKMPFFNLKKYHIVDAIIKLGLEDIFKVTPKCETNHKTLIDDIGCSNWHCRERRWAFTMINKNDLGIKYFIDKDY
jgi:prolyl 4-hydroxylase